MAEKHGITGPNRGQICKEYAIENTSTDLSQLTFVTPLTPKRRQRVSRKRLSGGEVSSPVPPTCYVVKKTWNDMIENGILSLGLPCVPFTLTRLVVREGSLHEDEIPVYGRKIPLFELRKMFLQRQEKWMRLSMDEELAKMSRANMESLCNDIGLNINGKTDEQLHEEIKLATRERCLAFWHDHATILGHGYLLVTVSVMYNSLFQ